MEQPTVSLFSALAVKKALDDVLLHAFTKETGVTVAGVYEPTNVLVRLIDEGARPDVLLGVTGALEKLGEAGILDAATLRPVATVGVALATGPDLDAPDIGTVDALMEALISARSVAYSRTGASGVYFAALLDRLGIADAVNRRATVVEKGFTARAIVDGRADLAIQQLSELMFVPEVKIVGMLPDGAQHRTEFSAALGSGAGDEADTLLRFLTGEWARNAYQDAGLEVPTGRLAQ